MTPPSSSSIDHYDTLGVPVHAGTDDIRQAYRRLVLSVHPDKNKAPGATAAFQKVSF